MRRCAGLWAVGLMLGSLGCKSTPRGETLASASTQRPPEAPASGNVAPSEPEPAPTPALTSTARLPEGPVLAIQAGQGVGPIRIGATVATIERLMEAPCDVKTPEVCRYITRAVEFFLDQKGFTERIVINRKDRPAGLDAQGVPRAYGFFNGGIPPGVALGMIPSAVLKMLGPPQHSERVVGENPNHTLDRDTYPGGMELEYDEYTNGKVMLGGVIITKPK